MCIRDRGYLAWVPKKQRLYVVLGNEMIAYTLDAQEVGRWGIEDGTPNAMEVAKNGKLYLAFGRDIVMYDVDGFRHGVIWSTDQLGLGYEDLDITIDDQKRIWIVTDQGWAFKYKTPKKLEYKVKMSDLSLVRPRIAAQDDILYCVDRDRIIRLDAMQAGDLDRSCRLMHAHLHGAQSKLQQNRSPENVDLLALFQGTD